MSTIALLQLLVALLISIQSPDVPVELKTQALKIAQDTLVSLQAPQSSVSLIPLAPYTPSSQTIQRTMNPAPEQNFAGQTPVPVSPYEIEITQSIPSTGGVIIFTVKKDGKPVEAIDKLTSNHTTQTFNKLPEDLPPGNRIFHIYLPGPAPENPALNLVIEGNELSVPITLQ